MRQLTNCFPQWIISSYTAELQLLLDFLFFRFTVSNDVITPGNTLQNLNFKFRSPKHKALLMVFTVFLPYVVTKLNERISSNNWNDVRTANQSRMHKLKYYFARLVSLLNNLFKLASLANLLMFFVTHTKRSVPERVLSIDLERIDASQRRYVDFTYINRLIVWNALGQALSSLLPFLDVSKIKGMFQMSQKLTEFITLDEKDINSDSWCAICGSTQICMPYRAKECQHIYCYYCVTAKIQEREEEEDGQDDQWKCVKCGSQVTLIEPYTLI